MEYRHNPPSLTELKKMRKPVKNARVAAGTSLTSLERFAFKTTRKIGSMDFFLFLLFWTVLWLGWNMFAPYLYRFDPAPAFVIWLFVSNILQLIFLPLIMVSQNIESRAADFRAQEDYDTNIKTEREVEAVLAHLENQNELLLEIARKIDHR